MDDADFLIDERSTSLVAPDGFARVPPAELRGHPLHVEQVLLRVAPAVEFDPDVVHLIRGELLGALGFAPRDIVVEDRAPTDGDWELLVHGERVDGSEGGADAIRASLVRHLYRMVTTDDVIELLAFARLESPAVIDHVIPHRVSLELLRSVLRHLLRDAIPIKPLGRIVEIMGSAPADLRDLDHQIDRVRAIRARTVAESVKQSDGELRVLALAPEAEQSCLAVLHDARSIDGSRRRRLVEHLAADISDIRDEHSLDPAVLVTSRQARADVANLLRDFDHRLRIVADSEIAHAVSTEVGIVGEGVRIAFAPPHPPRPPHKVWSDVRTVHDIAQVSPGGWEDIEDVEVID